MDLFILVLFVWSFLSRDSGVIGANWNLFKDDDLKIEKQLKLMNKPAVKTIKTWYGDLYDCVDFFKQPAFDHPLLKNYTLDFQVLPPSILKIIKTKRSKKVNKVDDRSFKAMECPVGTVPIQRVTKDDLIRETLTAKASTTENGQIEWAVVRTPSNEKRYSGGGAFLSVHNPQVIGLQSSSARVKITNGVDVIQAGWRVDPFLHKGDNSTRFFIHTKAGTTNCFNILCPGFVVVNHEIPVDFIMTDVSHKGGPIVELGVFISRGDYGNWNLYIGLNRLFLGYWPSSLFTGLSELASLLEWGGEIYSPDGATVPPMGSSEPYIVKDTRYNAFFRQVSTFDEAGHITNAENLESSNTKNYHVLDLGVIEKDEVFKHLILYTGYGTNPSNDSVAK